MAHAVQHHLGHSLLAGAGLQSRLIIDGCGQAADGGGPLRAAGGQDEGVGGRSGGFGLGHDPVDGPGLVHGEPAETEGGRGVDVQPRPAGRPLPRPVRGVRVVAGGDVQGARTGAVHQHGQLSVGEAVGGGPDHVIGALAGDLLGQGGAHRKARRQHQHQGDRELQRSLDGLTGGGVGEAPKTAGHGEESMQTVVQRGRPAWIVP